MTDSNRDQRPPRDVTWPGVPLVGLGIVLVGVIFLARNFGFDFPLPDRWWALFILIPAGGALVTAARLYNQDGRMSERAIGAATVGTLILASALILFLDLEWGDWWPVMVIIVGLGILARGFRR
jgi:hypothetical protein